MTDLENIKSKTGNLIRLEYGIIKTRLERVLLNEGFSEFQASKLAKIFSNNSLYGKDSHGINRFRSFINTVRSGNVKINVSPEKVQGDFAFEQWNGNYGPGPLNAKFCTDRVIELASKFGIGGVALKNTNHWMRGGTYGWQAAKAGFVLISWTNATPTMPPWGGNKAKLGNNPLVIAIPNENGHIVLDMAMSQYSYGKLEKLVQSNELTEYSAGYDDEGHLTNDPCTILKNKRALPMGLWKGSGLALVLDLLAAIMSEGRSSLEIGKDKIESGVSQIFIAIKPNPEYNSGLPEIIIKNILEDIRTAGANGNENILYPGESSSKIKEENLKIGVPVDSSVWKEILEMDN